jgi:hypothetical protein
MSPVARVARADLFESGDEAYVALERLRLLAAGRQLPMNGGTCRVQFQQHPK